MKKVQLIAIAFLLSAFLQVYAERYHRDHRIHAVADPNFPYYEPPSHWYDEAIKNINDKLANKLKMHQSRAKNLILMIGDGMGMSTITGSRLYKGEKDGLKFNEKGQLYMETFPWAGLSKSYCSNKQVADSACSTTAYSGGAKGNIKTFGVSAAVARKDCVASLNVTNQVKSVLQWAQENGKSTGIVTTTSITDASPGGSYAHTADRDWENDRKLKMDYPNGVPEGCVDTAIQLIHKIPGKSINVILGGGRRHFQPTQQHQDPDDDSSPTRSDNRDLIQEWKDDKKDKKGKYVDTATRLNSINAEDTDYLLGLFAQEDIGYNGERTTEPSLEDMTKKAIEILSKNPKGFYLFVEGGRIDHAHHDNNAHRSFEETLEFDRTVKIVDDITGDEDTLLVVSADHSHLITIAGYPNRGQKILGLVEPDENEVPETTLFYTNGPGYKKPSPSDCEPYKPTPNEDTFHKDYLQASMYYRDSATHAGEDVIILSKGPFAHLLTGINDQTMIAHVMKYAASIGSDEAESHAISATQLSSLFPILICIILPLI